MAEGHGLDRLIRFINEDTGWSKRLAQILDEHIGPALDEFDLEFADIGDLLGEPWSPWLGPRLLVTRHQRSGWMNRPDMNRVRIHNQ